VDEGYQGNESRMGHGNGLARSEGAGIFDRDLGVLLGVHGMNYTSKEARRIGVY